MRLGSLSLRQLGGRYTAFSNCAVTVSPDNLEFFAIAGYTPPTDGQAVTLTSNGEDGNAIVTAPDGYEVSADGIDYFSSLNIKIEADDTSYTFYIRMKDPDTGEHFANLTIEVNGITYVVQLFGYVGAEVLSAGDENIFIFEAGVSIGFTSEIS